MYDFLLIASTIVFIATVIVYLRQPAAGLAHPASFYLLFHGFIFVFRPLLARYYDFDLVYRLYQFQPSIDDKITVILGANLAMLVFVFATLLIAPNAPLEISREQHARTRAELARPILLAVALLTPLAIWSQIGNWALRINSFEAMARDAATGNMVNIQGNGWFTDSALMMAPMAAMMVWLSRYRWWGWAYFAVFAFLQAGTGTRQALVFAAAATAICLLLESGRRWFDMRAVLLVAIAAIAFNLLVIDRGGLVRSVVTDDYGTAYISNVELDPLEHMDFANLEYFEYMVYAVPKRTGTYDYFAHVLQVVTEPIPRVLWPDKPVGSPIQYFSLWDYGTPIGMTASIPGIGWMSLGYAGIVIQSLIFALIFGLLYRLLLTRRSSTLAVLAYALAISIGIIGFRDGTLLTLVRLVPFFFGPLLLALLFARISGHGRIAPPHLTTETLQAGFLEQTPAERRRALAAQARESSI